jgi:dTDP-D-glucose 4,6-dehydratase
MYIDDCIDGTLKIMASDIDEPVNLGSSELVTINQLVDAVQEIAGIEVVRRYNLDAPKGVRGRNSDNAMILERLGWEPSISLRTGLEKTYRWIYDQLSAMSAVETVKALRRTAFGRSMERARSARRVTVQPVPVRKRTQSPVDS